MVKGQFSGSVSLFINLAEVSKKETYGIGVLLRVTDGRAKTPINRQMVEVSSLFLSIFFFDYLPSYRSIKLSIFLFCLSI